MSLCASASSSLPLIKRIFYPFKILPLSQPLQLIHDSNFLMMIPCLFVPHSEFLVLSFSIRNRSWSQWNKLLSLFPVLKVKGLRDIFAFYIISVSFCQSWYYVFKTWWACSVSDFQIICSIIWKSFPHFISRQALLWFGSNVKLLCSLTLKILTSVFIWLKGSVWHAITILEACFCGREGLRTSCKIQRSLNRDGFKSSRDILKSSRGIITGYWSHYFVKVILNLLFVSY